MWAKQKQYSRQYAFTIVELLIVIVVIAILAAISIVAYNGIQNRARASAATSALNQASKKIALWQVDNPNVAPDCPTLNSLIGGVGNSCATTINAIYYQYTQGSGGSYCITATSTNISYTKTDTSSPTAGACPGHSNGGQVLVTNLATNPSFETNMTSWGNGGSGSSSRVCSEAYVGSCSASVNIAANAAADSGINMATQTISISVGSTYTASAWVKGASGIALKLQIDEYSGSSYVSQTNTGFTTTGSWQRVNLTRTIASGDNMRVNVRTTSTSASARVFYIDAIMVNEGSSAYTYGDGTSDGWSWSAAVNNSTSTGPAL